MPRSATRHVPRRGSPFVRTEGRDMSRLTRPTFLLGGAAFAVALLGTLSLTFAFGHKPSTAAFLTQALGAPAKVVPVVDAQRFHAHIAGRGYTARAGTASVSIAAADLPGGTWTRYAHGVSRATPFGHETITLASGRAEELQTVVAHHGTRTWRWQLLAPNLEPRLTAEGSVVFAAGATTSALHVLPVTIYDRAGGDITPTGARWSLHRAKVGWWLELKLDDSTLPVPYTIDPATAISGLTLTEVQ